MSLTSVGPFGASLGSAGNKQTFFCTLTGFIFFATARILFDIPTWKLDFFLDFKGNIGRKNVNYWQNIYTNTKKLKGEFHKPSSLLSLDLSSSLLLESSLAFPPVDCLFYFISKKRKMAEKNVNLRQNIYKFYKSKG